MRELILVVGKATPNRKSLIKLHGLVVPLFLVAYSNKQIVMGEIGMVWLWHKKFHHFSLHPGFTSPLGHCKTISL